MAPIAPPTFSGHAKDWALFSRQWQDLVKPYHTPMAEYQYLIHAIPKNLWNTLSHVGKTPDQVWTQLEEKFNSPKVLLKETMADLHSLDWRKLGANNFLKNFASMLEDTEQTLVGIGNEDYLRHAREVACLEDMLPEVEKVEYAKRYTTYYGMD